MEDRILVITSSILDQGSLPEDKMTAHGPLSVVKDLIDLNINLVSLPNIEKHYEMYINKSNGEIEDNEETHLHYIRTRLVPIVNEVMERVRSGATFLGILSYGADKTQSVEPNSSLIMIELFRLFDRNCMLTPYYEIRSNLSSEEMALVISDIAVTLGI